MCRYVASGPYKSHFACFRCRKAFKQPPIEDYLSSRGRGYVYERLRQGRDVSKHALQIRELELGRCLSDLKEEYRNATHRCAECADEMIDMGLDFKPPRQSDLKAWSILEAMFCAGHAFQTCGCDGPGRIPKSTNDYREYLAARKKEYEEHLERVQKSATALPEARQKAAKHWASRIQAIEAEQMNVGP